MPRNVRLTAGVNGIACVVAALGGLYLLNAPWPLLRSGQAFAATLYVLASVALLATSAVYAFATFCLWHRFVERWRIVGTDVVYGYSGRAEEVSCPATAIQLVKTVPSVFFVGSEAQALSFVRMQGRVAVVPSKMLAELTAARPRRA